MRSCLAQHLDATSVTISNLVFDVSSGARYCMWFYAAEGDPLRQSKWRHFLLSSLLRLSLQNERLNRKGVVAVPTANLFQGKALSILLLENFTRAIDVEKEKR